ncbi:tetratricopeptide repeat protein [Crocosphaera sp. XPORK-15E]|uniref:tetratricopeptide repeat protein n=1 Tax=Crocosphaera sp. XPORK-15E TaxID=3110247 RepID=UPI002B1EF43D|nr:tetratricopeptide repeat protein [Crocosphaera sp. XPORK-15E]MEA5535032.1 tetratricopeptide repeat protein [Crocosphaera sp. XPORK-15E]
MSETNSLATRYHALIDSIVDITLQGKIRSKEQVYRMLVKDIESGTGEIFERILDEHINKTKAQLETKLKATRVLRALETIDGEWKRWQHENQTDAAIATATEQIKNAESSHSLASFLKLIDSSNAQNLTREQLQKLSQSLKASSNSSETLELANGIIDGLNAFVILEPDLIGWIYEQNKSALGFGEEKQGPWHWWEKKIDRPLAKMLFQNLTNNESIRLLAERSYQVELRAWVELIILLQYLQQGLVKWFDQQPYNAKFGQRLSYSTLLTFAVIFAQLSQGFEGRNNNLKEGCFLMMLQLLRQFARRKDFPLYGGIFASFSGDNLRETLTYFDDPLKEVERTQEKARILTLLAYSQRTLGNYERAKSFHLEALEIAREALDKPCEIANLNHLSRIYIYEKTYDEAISYSQRALVFSRQVGDKLGEANGLINVGYSEVFRAREIEQMEPEIYESAINYLEQGLTLAERLGEYQSQALGYNSLGIAYVVLSQPAAAITALEKGNQMALNSGDVYLQGLNFTYLAEAYYTLGNLSTSVYYSCLGMYLLEQIQSSEWRQCAGLLMVIKGQMTAEEFQKILEQNRPQIIKFIGVDGYDELPKILERYRGQ